MKDKLSYITNNMKSYRIRAGLSQQQTADKLSVVRETYCDYEVNPQKVKIETFQKLASIFRCKLSDFFMELSDTYSDKNKEE